jgi:predicted small lipoprotein YifL
LLLSDAFCCVSAYHATRYDQKIDRRMKHPSLALLLFTFLTACGQPGPLYLPTDKPPIYVEPEPETTDVETETEKKEHAKPGPPQPETKQPIIEQQ